MKKIFVKTKNYMIFEEIMDELESEKSQIGSSMAMIIGKAGRGKTEAAKYYAINSQAIYIRTLPVWTSRAVLQEISYELSGSKPHLTNDCLALVEAEMKNFRRIVLIDEADLLDIKVIETLRGVNERCNTPIVLIGEEGLKKKLSNRTRIISRIRREMVFEPICQTDIIHFYKQSMEINLDSDVAALLLKKADGDWRPMVNAATKIYTAMQVSGIHELTKEVVEEVLK